MRRGILFGLLFALGLLLVRCGEVADVCEGVVCDDDNVCSEDACDPAEGACVFTEVAGDTACSVDGHAGRCIEGACVGWCDGVDCDDGNACTDNVCDSADGSCDHSWAEDGTECSLGEYPGQCASGVCAGLCEGVDCDDGNDCTEDLCDRGTGECTHPHRPDGAECDFGELPGVCESGVCVDAQLCGEVDCSDGNACTDDVCDPVDASCSNPNKVDGATCEVEGLPGECADGGCVGLCEAVDCEDANECTEDTCDPMTGSCVHTPVEDETECDFEGGPGVCQMGACVSACDVVLCDDDNDCTEDTCNPADGSCSHPNKDDGTACEIAGTAGECRQGACGGIFDCTEERIRAAIAVGGGPHTFDCNGPTTVTTQDEIVIDNDVILDGEGNLRVRAPLCGRFLGDPPLVLPCHRVISVSSGITAELIGMTIAEGCAEGGEGSGILNFGTLRLRGTQVVDNGWMHEWSESCEYGPCGNGGGIYNGGTLTLTNSGVSDNVAGGEGGGIYNAGTVKLIRSAVVWNVSVSGGAIRNTGSLTMLDSTVSHNQADSSLCRIPCDTGDILSGDGSVLMINSTVSDNSMNCVGSGRIIVGSGTLINSTISGNDWTETYSLFHLIWDGDVISSTIAGDNPQASYQDGFLGGRVRLTNSMIVNTAPDPGPACSSYASVESGGGNVESPGNSCGLDTNKGDQVNVTAEQLNLGPLQNNGGPTQTRALLTEPTVSVAIDHVPAQACLDADGEPLTTDQRGQPRPEIGDSMCDVGAFEVQP